MPHDPYRSLYIHIPFCKSKCNYCDFRSSKTDIDSPEIPHYIEQLIMDVRRLSKEGELSDIETIYIGGGTPSYIGSKYLVELLYALSTTLNLTEDVECTVEANPESLDLALVKDLWALGVSRLSIGVQSFDDHLLQTLGRAHSADDAKKAIEVAHERFDNVSVDLMCGLPDQTLETFTDSLRTALECGVNHISVYPLTIENGTKFENLMRKGKLHLPADDDVADMMLQAERILTEAGFHRYEVASYARPGYECKHNTSYWSAVPYIGIGSSAVTMTQNDIRRMRLMDGRVIDDLDPRTMAAEDLMCAMRMSKGVSDEEILRIEQTLPGVEERMKELAELGLVERSTSSWVPTQKGWLLGNELYGSLLELAD